MFRILSTALALTIVAASSASAVIVFSLEQETPGPIVIGNNAVVKVMIRSDAGTITNLAGIDFVIEANDPGFVGTVTSGGRFTSGTNNMFAPNGGYAFPFPSSFQVFGANAGAGLTLTAIPTILGTLVLATTGATPGNYAMNLSSLTVVDPLYNSLPTNTPGPLNYTLTAVPEPGSTALAAAGLAFLIGSRRRRKQTTPRA